MVCLSLFGCSPPKSTMAMTKPTSPSPIELADKAHAAGDSDGAIAILDSARKKSKGVSVEETILVGTILAETDRKEEAIKEYQTLFHLDPRRISSSVVDSGVLHARICVLYHQLGKSAEFDKTLASTFGRYSPGPTPVYPGNNSTKSQNARVRSLLNLGGQLGKYEDIQGRDCLYRLAFRESNNNPVVGYQISRAMRGTHQSLAAAEILRKVKGPFPAEMRTLVGQDLNAYAYENKLKSSYTSIESERIATLQNIRQRSDSSFGSAGI